MNKKKAEIQDRIVEEIKMLEQKIAGFQSRLSNESYVSNAPAEVVQETKYMLAKVNEELVAAKKALGK